MILRKRERDHKKTMLMATASSLLFLVNYLIFHSVHGHTPFEGFGTVRTIYLAILISHTILAVALVPLAAATLYFGLRTRREIHKRIARYTLPVWIYVSITGVTIYFMLYS
jgi:putative membrane protein